MADIGAAYKILGRKPLEIVLLGEARRREELKTSSRDVLTGSPEIKTRHIIKEHIQKIDTGYDSSLFWPRSIPQTVLIAKPRRKYSDIIFL